MAGVTLQQGLNSDVQYNGGLFLTVPAAFHSSFSWLIRVHHWNGSQWLMYDPNDLVGSDLYFMEPGKFYDISFWDTYFWEWPDGASEWLTPGWTRDVVYQGPHYPAEVAFWPLHGALITAWAWVNGAWVMYDPNDKVGSNLQRCCPGQQFDINLSQNGILAWHQVPTARPVFDSYSGPESAVPGEEVEVMIGIRNVGNRASEFIITVDEETGVVFVTGGFQDCPVDGVVSFPIIFTMPDKDVDIDVNLFHWSPECTEWLYAGWQGWDMILGSGPPPGEPDIQNLEVGYAKVA